MSDLRDNPIVYGNPKIGFTAEKSPNGGWVVFNVPGPHDMRVTLASFSNGKDFLSWLCEEMRDQT